MNQQEYLLWYEKYNTRLEDFIEKLKVAEQERASRKARHQKFKEFISIFKNTPNVLLEFDEQLWIAIIDKVIIGLNGTCKFLFCNGSEFII